MAIPNPPTVDELPPAPVRADAPADYVTKADAMIAALVRMITQLNALKGWFLARANEVFTWAGSAEQSATVASEKALQVAANTNTVAANTSTVVQRADEVAINTNQVAADRQKVAVDRIAVDDALASITDGPVTSVAGKTGIVTAEDINQATRARTQARILSFM